MEETGGLVPKPRVKKGLWKPKEDLLLKKYVEAHGEGKWATVSERSGLMRSGKSCRLRWKNYLRPNIKRGGISKDEEDIIVRMHKLLGNRWSLIAGRLPGRTDNDVKNYWNTRLNKGRSRGKERAPAVMITLGTKDAEDCQILGPTATEVQRIAVKDLMEGSKRRLIIFLIIILGWKIQRASTMT